VAIANLIDPEATPDIQRKRLDFLQRSNQRLLDRVTTDPQMEGIINSFELAFRMQTETPDLVNLASESKETFSMYGIDGGRSDVNGRACLISPKAE
jgi:hypothetical protein